MKRLAIAVVVLLVAVPAVYAAEFRGRTSQDRPVVVRTDADGLLKRFTIKWRARCGDGSRLTLRQSFVPPYRKSTDTRVRERITYSTRVPDEDGRTYHVRVRARIRGHLETEDEWRGRFRALAEVSRDGRHVANCNKRGIRWTATG